MNLPPPITPDSPSYQQAAPHLAPTPRLGRWIHWPIGVKLASGFGVLLVGIALLSIASLIGLNRVQQSYQDAIDRAVQNERLARDIETALLQARRNEKDFFLRWQTEGFDQAYQTYVGAHQQAIALALRSASTLRERVDAYRDQDDLAIGQDVLLVEQQTSLYQREFLAALELVRQRGFRDSGVEGEFRTVARGLEDHLTEARSDALLIVLLQLRRAEKDYLLRGEAEYVALVADYAAALKRGISTSRFTTAQQSVMVLLVDDYLGLFNRLVELDRQIAQRIEAYRAAAHTIEPLVVRIADVEKRNAAADVLTAERLSSTTLVSVMLGIALMLILALFMAWLLTRQITRPIRGLAETARQITAGELNVQAPVIARDEIGVFAQTFNLMTATLHQTLESLDQRRREVEREKQRSDALINGIIPIGVALTAEKDFGRLLELITVEAQAFCRADAGTLYLKTDHDQLQAVIVRNVTLDLAMGGASGNPVTLPELALYTAEGAKNTINVTAAAALTGQSCNIPDVYDEADQFDFTGPQEFDQQHGYRTASLLAIPLTNPLHEVIGVLQLINAQHPETGGIVPFSAELQQMIESLADLAAAALLVYAREQHLRQEIQQLKIEIDGTRQARMLAEITETDFFRDLQQKARSHRARRADLPHNDSAP